jgi:hypothetical protein
VAVFDGHCRARLNRPIIVGIALPLVKLKSS